MTSRREWTLAFLYLNTHTNEVINDKSMNRRKSMFIEISIFVVALFPTFSQYMRWSCFFFLLLIEYLLNFFFGQLQIDLGSSSTPRYKKLRLEGWFSVMWQLLHYITIENGSCYFSELKLLFLAAQLYTYTWMVTEWPFSFLLFSYRFQMVDCGCVQFCMNIKMLMSHSSKS